MSSFGDVLWIAGGKPKLGGTTLEGVKPVM
jgi:hypothetical protein